MHDFYSPQSEGPQKPENNDCWESDIFEKRALVTGGFRGFATNVSKRNPRLQQAKKWYTLLDHVLQSNVAHIHTHSQMEMVIIIAAAFWSWRQSLPYSAQGWLRCNMKFWKYAQVCDIRLSAEISSWTKNNLNRWTWPLKFSMHMCNYSVFQYFLHLVFSNKELNDQIHNRSMSCFWKFYQQLWQKWHHRNKRIYFKIKRLLLFWNALYVTQALLPVLLAPHRWRLVSQGVCLMCV